MYAQVTGIKVKPEFVAEFPKIAEQFAGLHKAQKGFVRQTLLVDEESGEGLALSLWETKEDQDAAVAVCVRELQKSSGMLIEEPTLKAYKVAYKD